MNQLASVLSIAVSDGVAERFPKCQFDRGFLPGNAMRSFD
jgi:hypothetical protein